MPATRRSAKCRRSSRSAREYEAKLADIEGALERDRTAARERIRDLKARDADSALIVQANRDLAALPKDAASAREYWTRALQDSIERSRPLGGLPRHSLPFAGDPHGTPDQREALFMIVLQEKSYEAAAEVTGCAIGTLKSRVHRARLQLRSYLTGEQQPQARAAA